jgi:hypothetical protein
MAGSSPWPTTMVHGRVWSLKPVNRLLLISSIAWWHQKMQILYTWGDIRHSIFWDTSSWNPFAPRREPRNQLSAAIGKYNVSWASSPLARVLTKQKSEKYDFWSSKICNRTVCDEKMHCQCAEKVVMIFVDSKSVRVVHETISALYISQNRSVVTFSHHTAKSLTL